MQELLNALLEAHARQGGSVILLSATLPQSMREGLVNAFCKGLGQLDMPVLNYPVPYPLATHAPAAIVVHKSMAEMNVLKFNKSYTRMSGDWGEETRIPNREWQKVQHQAI